jgi:bacteriorhodopsin
MGDLFQPWHLIIIVIISAFYGTLIVVPFWQIFKKSGKGGALAILMIVPLVNLIMLFYLAFSNWNVTPISSSARNVE